MVHFYRLPINMTDDFTETSLSDMLFLESVKRQKLLSPQVSRTLDTQNQLIGSRPRRFGLVAILYMPTATGATASLDGKGPVSLLQPYINNQRDLQGSPEP